MSRIVHHRGEGVGVGGGHLLYSPNCSLLSIRREVHSHMNAEKDESVKNSHGNVNFVHIGVDANRQRIDNFLITHWKGVPKSRIYRLIRKGEIRINKKRVKPETRLQSGDILRLPPIRVADPVTMERPGQALLSMIRDSILFENSDMLVVNKPQGIAVHGGTGQRTGFIEALRWLRADEGSTDTFFELAHRIDKETSGCLVICKNAIFLKYVQEALKARRVTKVYLALVHGRWPSGLREVDASLQKIIVSSGEKVVKVSDLGKPSTTTFKILREFANATLIEARPLTGRMHQIRVHCQVAGHPIIGDPKYTLTKATVQLDGLRLCLHAASICFELPDGGGYMDISAPLNPAMEAIMGSL